MPYKDPASPRAIESRQRANLKHKYNLSWDDFRALLEAQESRCFLCEKEFDLTQPYACRVDHDHETGEVRGILCNPCNIGLGAFRDDQELMGKAIMYLRGDLRPVRI